MYFAICTQEIGLKQNVTKVTSDCRVQLHIKRGILNSLQKVSCLKFISWVNITILVLPKNYIL